MANGKLVQYHLLALAVVAVWGVTFVSTNYVYLNPVFTLLTATALLGERMTLWAAIGSAAILAGVIWAGKRS